MFEPECWEDGGCSEGKHDEVCEGGYGDGHPGVPHRQPNVHNNIRGLQGVIIKTSSRPPLPASMILQTKKFETNVKTRFKHLKLLRTYAA